MIVDNKLNKEKNVKDQLIPTFPNPSNFDWCLVYGEEEGTHTHFTKYVTGFTRLRQLTQAFKCKGSQFTNHTVIIVKY